MDETEEKQELLRLIDKYAPAYLAEFPLDEGETEYYSTPIDHFKREMAYFTDWLTPKVNSKTVKPQELIGKTVAIRINSEWLEKEWMVYEVSEHGAPTNIRLYENLVALSKAEKQVVQVI